MIVLKGNRPYSFFHLQLIFFALVISLGVPLSAHADQSASSETPVTQLTVNINDADAETIAATLNGVGERKALAIVSYRQNNGPFTSPEELMEIKGIGEKILQTNKHRIVLE